MKPAFAPNAQEPSRRTVPGTAGGVLDTIADGLSIVLGRPLLMMLPLAVDLLLWLVVHVSAKPLAERVASFVEASGANDSDMAAHDIRQIGERVQAGDALSAFLPSVISGIPLDSLLNILVMVMSPNAAYGLDREAIPGALGAGAIGNWTPASASAVALAGAAFIGLGTLFLALYRVPLARAVRGDTAPGLLSEVVRAWVHFVGYLALLLIAAIVSFVPLFFAALLLVLLGLNPAFVVLMALLVFGGIASIYTLFMVDAMLLHRIGPIQAASMSMAVGRAYFGQTSRYAFTTLVVSLAALQLWSTLVQSIPGIMVAILANAFLGTGLTFAGMLFYSDRFRLLKASRHSSGTPVELHRSPR